MAEPEFLTITLSCEYDKSEKNYGLNKGIFNFKSQLIHRFQDTDISYFQ